MLPPMLPSWVELALLSELLAQKQQAAMMKLQPIVSPPWAWSPSAAAWLSVPQRLGKPIPKSGQLQEPQVSRPTTDARPGPQRALKPALQALLAVARLRLEPQVLRPQPLMPQALERRLRLRVHELQQRLTLRVPSLEQRLRLRAYALEPRLRAQMLE
jgi:hypothetical protein